MIYAHLLINDLSVIKINDKMLKIMVINMLTRSGEECMNKECMNFIRDRKHEILPYLHYILINFKIN